MSAFDVTPQESPGSFDKIKIGKRISPGTCRLQSGGELKAKVDVQSQPGYMGAVAIYSGLELSELTYRFELSTIKDLNDWEPFAKLLKDSLPTKGGRRAAVLPIVDPRLRTTNITKVTVKSISAQLIVRPGLWAHDVVLLQYIKPIEVPRLPANQAVQDAFKKEAQEASAARDAAQKAASQAVNNLNKEAAPVIGALQSALEGG